MLTFPASRPSQLDELVRRELTAVANLLKAISYNKSADGMVLLCPGRRQLRQRLEARQNSRLCPCRPSWTRGRARLRTNERGGAFPEVSGHLRTTIGGMRAYPLSF
jgi:hypothetical protein